MKHDIIICGAGSSGLMASIFAARGGARVLLVEHAAEVGGSLHVAGGHMSAAGTRLQAAKGIEDSPDRHFDDVMRISNGTADPAKVRIAVDNAADTLHWLLDHGLEVLPEHPVLVHGHEPYSVPRTCWGADKAVSVLDVLRPQLDREIAAGRIELRLETELVAVCRDDEGAIAGVRLRRGDGAEDDVRAPVVVLACGGYAANAALFPELTAGYPLFSQAYPYSQGTGLRLVRDLGGILGGGEMFLPTFGRVEDPERPGRITNITHTVPQYRQPWEVYVNLAGRRFVAEDEPSADRRERVLLEQPQLTFWALFDEAIRRRAPPFFHDIADDALAALWNGHPSYVRADSWPELAARMNVPADALAATVRDYNEIQARGADPLGRRHLPAPLAEPPFYAVRHHGISVVGFAGVKVDDDFRVCLRDGGSVPNLYAVGEMLGFATLNGNAFVSGMGVTPALTFGRLLGQRLAAAARKAASTA